jgi:hypothetical protein
VVLIHGLHTGAGTVGNGIRNTPGRRSGERRLMIVRPQTSRQTSALVYNARYKVLRPLRSEFAGVFDVDDQYVVNSPHTLPFFAMLTRSSREPKSACRQLSDRVCFWPVDPEWPISLRKNIVATSLHLGRIDRKRDDWTMFLCWPV